MNPSVRNKFSQSQLFSLQVKSPQARLTDHHKQGFYFLLQNYIVKPYHFYLQTAWDYKFQTLPNLTIFSSLRIRSKENLSISAATQDNLEPILLQKDEILDWLSIPHPWMKPGTSHLTTSLLSYLFHLATSLPSHLSHLSHLATSLPSNLSELATSLFLTFPTSPAHYLPPFPAQHSPSDQYITPKRSSTR